MVLASSACSGSHGETDAGAADTGTVPDGGELDAGPPPDGGPEPLCRPPADCRVEAVVAGTAHTCVRLPDGRVGCWGGNRYFQLAQEGVEASVWPLEVSGLPEVTRLIRGYLFTCGLAADGELWCWGDGTELMFDETGGPSSGWVSRLSDITDLAAGGAHVCALQSTGRVSCWGFRGGDGQLGIGTRDVHLEPQLVEGIDDVVELASGYSHTCARTGSEQLYCWGRNREGQIGDGTGGEPEPTADALSPVLVLDGVRRVVTGGNFTCALRGAGEVLCWGSNMSAQIGTGSFARTVPSPEPVALPAGIDIADIVAGAAHTCALATSGRVLCWGANDGGALGYGSMGFTRLPVEVGGIDDATAIALGYEHTCAIRGDGELWCWGLNDEGQVGDGTTVDRGLPVRVVGLR